MNYKTIKIKEEGKIATVILNREEIHNAFNEDLIFELTNCFNNIAESSYRIVILTANGDYFCSGADLNWMKKLTSLNKEENINDAENLFKMFETINNCPKPIIGKINGSAFGGGVGLIAVCDIAVCHSNCLFAFSEVKLGITSAVISSFVVPKIGLSNARELFISGERFSAEKALKIGLVHEVVEKENLQRKIEEKIRVLLSSSPNAIKECKLLLRKFAELSKVDYKKFSIEKLAELRLSKEGKEGINAFLEKRKANWCVE